MVADASFAFPEQPVPLYWNGLLLRVPPSWTPAVLDKYYLLVEDDQGPVMEVKWGKIRGKLSFDKVFQKLSKELKGAEFFSGDGGESQDPSGRDDSKPAEETIPRPWAEAVAELERRMAEQEVRAQPIFWRVRDHLESELPAKNITAGRGAVVHSSVSGLAWMIQFYEAGGRSVVEDAIAILHSLQNPDPNHWLPWELFGIRFRTPPWLELAAHSFKAGRYRLEFKNRGWKSPTRLVLERIAPARAVLKGKGLREWAEAYYAKELGSLRALDTTRSSVEVRWQKPPSGWTRRGSRAFIRLSEDGRMILAMFLLQARLAELNEFGSIGNTYATIPRHEGG
ncbi:MAG: hypothetical protein EA399_12205 [Desulfovibrionales bacterium]|nr:MAG: hypothetical protein EA399_12205 [Desulfovibrionales bacterium]